MTCDLTKNDTPLQLFSPAFYQFKLPGWFLFNECRLMNKTTQRHGVKVGPGPRTLDPPQNLKLGPGTLLKFKSGTPGLPSKFKSGFPRPPTKFKSGTPLPFFNEFIFSEYFFAFFSYLFLCLF